VEEVTLTTSQGLKPFGNNSSQLGLRNKLSEKLLTNEIPGFGWTDERKAVSFSPCHF